MAYNKQAQMFYRKKLSKRIIQKTAQKGNPENYTDDKIQNHK